MPHKPMPTRAKYRPVPPPRDEVIYDKSFKSTFRWVRRAIHETMDGLEAANLQPDLLGSIEIALAEALNNVVEHAYPEHSPGTIRLKLQVKRAAILVEIRDRGSAMPYGQLPKGQPVRSGLRSNQVSEGGYGWYIIRELVQDLIYDRQDGENVLIFRLSLDPRLQ